MSTALVTLPSSLSFNNYMQTLAIVPARGGSKSIPRKNIIDLNGKPLIAYALSAIKSSSSVWRVIVSTEDAEIAEVAKKYGAEVPFVRPKELAEDATPGLPVLEHAIKWLEENENYKPDYVLAVQPTSPFVTSDQIDKLFNLVINKNADSGITMVDVPRFYHPYHLRKLNQEGLVEFYNEEMHYKHPARQLDSKLYAHGNMWWFRRDVFLKEKKAETGKRVGLEIDHASAFDINEPADLEMASYILKMKQS